MYCTIVEAYGSAQNKIQKVPELYSCWKTDLLETAEPFSGEILPVAGYVTQTH
jgi:hypothetical protein